ncbi:USP-like protein isoform 3 [Hibiscus syriacus]|uniref:USP-like protein isoform 3 n=1 Tax=Hibiscus syriacus TaxID=106335 RepID=A0A6A2XP99_HIBSY|nr:universal stress protein A-like protein [Hibiscus syriacus]KAE8660199.1 USP-like protein isoform 3 [Hibiscus syriacus]
MADDDQAVAKDRKILVAVDEGEESMYALSWCLKNLAPRSSKDTLILLYAKPPRTVSSSLDGTGYMFSADILATMDKYSDDVAACIIEKAKRICREQADYEVKVEVKIESGDPRDVICQVAQKIDADVLVMGTHGYGLIKRAFLGSVSNHCAQNVNCPVLIVKKPKGSSSACGTK